MVGLNACEKGSLPEGVSIIDTKEAFLEYLGEERLMALSRIEHLRWNAFYFSNGWDVLSPDKTERWKDPVNKLHSCLTTWDELTKVSQKFNEDYQLKDVQQVENIIEYLKTIDYVVFKE